MSWDAPTNTFDMGDMSQAVNGVADTDGNLQHENGHDESASAEAPERVGDWAARTPLNYEALNADRNTAHTYEESGAIPVWAHNAAKYEWVDEYGDGKSALWTQYRNRTNMSVFQLALAFQTSRRSCFALAKQTCLKLVWTSSRTMTSPLRSKAVK